MDQYDTAQIVPKRRASYVATAKRAVVAVASDACAVPEEIAHGKTYLLPGCRLILIQCAYLGDRNRKCCYLLLGSFSHYICCALLPKWYN